MGISNAEHQEYGRPSEHYVIVPVSCPVPDRAAGAPKLSGRLRVRLRPGSRLQAIYGRNTIEEEYFCNYELNRSWQERLETAGLRISAWDEEGAARAVELEGHPFFFATQFLPQDRAGAGETHPFVLAFVKAAVR